MLDVRVLRQRKLALRTIMPKRAEWSAISFQTFTSFVKSSVTTSFTDCFPVVMICRLLSSTTLVFIGNGLPSSVVADTFTFLLRRLCFTATTESESWYVRWNLRGLRSFCDLLPLELLEKRLFTSLRYLHLL